MKLGITLDDALVQRLDNYADANYMSRSGLISIALTQYLNTSDVTFAIKDLAVSTRKLSEKNVLDDEALELIHDLERLSKILSKG